MSRRQALILVLAVLTVSWSGPLIRLAKEAPPLAIAFWRTGIATALLAPAALLLHRKEIRRLGRRDLLALALSGAFLALHFATWIASVNLTTVASSALLVGATPVFVAIVSNFIGEPSSRREWAGIAVAIAGATLVAGADLGEVATAARGNLLALAGAICGAGYVIIGRRLRQRLSLLTYVVSVYGSCAVLLAAAVTISETPLVGFRPATGAAILAIALGPQLFGHTAINFLLEQIEATKITVAILGEPIGAALIAALLFDEIPGLLVIPGGILLLAGIWLVAGAVARAGQVAPSG